GIVSTLAAGTFAARPLGRRLSARAAVSSGSSLLALGLVALALLPSSEVGYLVVALALCGIGLGLAVPLLSADALERDEAARSGALTVGVRHLGLVLAVAVVATILSTDLPAAGRRATLRATRVLLDAPVPLSVKLPVAGAIAQAFERARAGQVPD